MLDLILGVHLYTYHTPREYPFTAQVCETEQRKPPIGAVASGNAGNRCWLEESKRKFENGNVGLYVRDPKTGFGGGFYRNSYSKWSLHTEWNWEPVRYAAVSLGAATGYPGHKMTAFVIPSVAYPIGKVTPRLSFIPKRRDHASAFHLSVEYELGR